MDSLEGVEAHLPGSLEGWKHTYRTAKRGGKTLTEQPEGLYAHLPGSLEGVEAHLPDSLEGRKNTYRAA
jgi:hypothetical protein